MTVIVFQPLWKALVDHMELLLELSREAVGSL